MEKIKDTMRSLLLVLFLSTAIFTGCNNAPKKEIVNNPNECTQYACPMHPDKTSIAPAKCPVCNMDMELVKVTKNDSAKTNSESK